MTILIILSSNSKVLLLNEDHHHLAGTHSDLGLDGRSEMNEPPQSSGEAEDFLTMIIF